MFSKLEIRLGSHAGFPRAALRNSPRMCTTVTALSQISLIHRELLLHGRNAARFSQQRKSCINNVSLGNFLTPRLGDNWRIPKACFSSQNASSSAPSSIATDGFPGSLTKQTAKELVSKLTSDERNLFLTALQECKSVEEKAELEGQLAAFRWRSKFGRPVKVPTLGDVDPTGTYCPVPEDWFHKKYVEKVPEPSTKDLVFG